MISARQRAGPIAGLALSLVFGGLLVLTATADLFMVGKLPTDRALPFTVRIPSIGLYKDTITGGSSYRFLRLREPRGVRPSIDQLRLIQAYEDQRRPPSPNLLLGLGVTFFLLLVLYTTSLRTLSPPTGLFRTQLVLLLGLLLLAIGAKVYLMVTPWSAMWIPLAALIIPVAVHLGPRVAGATTIAGAMVLSLLVPIDLPLLVVLLCQGLAAGAVAGRKGRLPLMRATLASIISGGIAYVGASLLLQQFVPGLDVLQRTADWVRWLDSDLAGSLGGGLAGGLAAVIVVPVAGHLFGIVPRSKLHELANLDNPLLKQIATRAPGTWAHTLAVANTAEMAANAIGADALLVRVGAYYHDLGKSVQPEYFIENQAGGPNPHDNLDPEVSADAIFSHVTEGVKLARKHKLPAAVVEFIYTHHGRSLLEYFWHKNMKAGNPRDLDEKDFRYPGCPPQSPETAILCLCDAVEAASRTIKDADVEKIRQLVRQIVFTKLEQPMLNDAGLTIEQLQRVSASLVETLRSFFHVRVKYPWQEAEEKIAPAARPGTGPRQPATAAVVEIVDEPSGEVIPLIAARPKTASELSDLAKERNRVMTMPLGLRGRSDATGPAQPPAGRPKDKV
jgi:cyclic-di-AMP phosphodiesterase PgpH